MNRRTIGFWLALAIVVIVVGYTTSSRRNDTGQPLDPDSTAGLGTRALVELVERFGAEVTSGLPTADTTVTLVLVDQLDDGQRGGLQDWVDQGGTVVVADPGSPLTPDLASSTVERQDSLASGSCTVPALDGLRLEAGSFLRYDVAGATRSCFGDEEAAYLHEVDRGDGRIVALGGGAALTNHYLDQVDNAVLAVELLVAPSGSASVAIVFEPILTPGSRSLSDLIPTSVRWGAVQLVVAAALFILWKARRFGRPVDEPQSVKLPGSLLVRASAELRRRTGGHAAADSAIRHHHERDLRQRLKAPADLPTRELITTVEEAAAVDRATIERSLLGPPTTTGTDLVELVRVIDTVRLGLDEMDRVPTAVPETVAPDLEPQPAGGRT